MLDARYDLDVTLGQPRPRLQWGEYGTIKANEFPVLYWKFLPCASCQTLHIPTNQSLLLHYPDVLQLTLVYTALTCVYLRPSAPHCVDHSVIRRCASVLGLCFLDVLFHVSSASCLFSCTKMFLGLYFVLLATCSSDSSDLSCLEAELPLSINLDVILMLTFHFLVSFSKSLNPKYQRQFKWNIHTANLLLCSRSEALKQHAGSRASRNECEGHSSADILSFFFRMTENLLLKNESPLVSAASRPTKHWCPCRLFLSLASCEHLIPHSEPAGPRRPRLAVSVT